jgi:hypothetical protein
MAGIAFQGGPVEGGCLDGSWNFVSFLGFGQGWAMGWLTSYEPSPAHPRGTDPFFSYVAADPAQPICDFSRRFSPFSAHHFEKKIVYKFNN